MVRTTLFCPGSEVQEDNSYSKLYVFIFQRKSQLTSFVKKIIVHYNYPSYIDNIWTWLFRRGLAHFDDTNFHFRNTYYFVLYNRIFWRGSFWAWWGEEGGGDTFFKSLIFNNIGCTYTSYISFYYHYFYLLKVCFSFCVSYACDDYKIWHSSLAFCYVFVSLCSKFKCGKGNSFICFIFFMNFQ